MMPTRVNRDVLILDDDPVSRRVLCALTISAGLNPIEVANATEAKQVLTARAQSLSVALVDRSLPDADGVDLIPIIRAECPSYVPILLVTSKSAEQSIIEGLERGADDYISKPVRHGELLARLRTAQRTHDLASHLQRNTQQMQQDLREAQTLQLRALPGGVESFGGLRCAALFRPCGLVGGDTYSYGRVDADRMGFYLADVSGHGVAAGMLAMWLSCTVTGASYLDSTPADILGDLDRRMESLALNRYFTAFQGTVDTETGALTYCRAGHPVGLLLRKSGTIIALEEGGPPVGLGLGLEYANGVVQLQPGDRLFVYTDGITEARCFASDEMLGEDRMQTLVGETRGLELEEQISTIVAAVSDHCGDKDPDDDITLLGLEWRK